MNERMKNTLKTTYLNANTYRVQRIRHSIVPDQ